MSERVAQVLAVALVVVLVTVLGGVAASRVIDRSERRRNAAPAAAEIETPIGPGPTDDVGLVGDSITLQSESQFHELLDGTYQVRVRARGGYRIEEMEPYAIELSTAQPEQVIINLGTNDVLTNWPIDKSAAALQRLIRVFSKVRCVHIVTLHEGFYRDTEPDVGGRAAVFNLEIRRFAKEHNLHVIDWAGAVVIDERDGSPNGPLFHDTVHPTPAGERKLAELYRDALNSCA